MSNCPLSREFKISVAIADARSSFVQQNIVCAIHNTRNIQKYWTFLRVHMHCMEMFVDIKSKIKVSIRRSMYIFGSSWMYGANRPVHWFFGGKGLGIQQGTCGRWIGAGVCDLPPPGSHHPEKRKIKRKSIRFRPKVVGCSARLQKTKLHLAFLKAACPYNPNRLHIIFKVQNLIYVFTSIE